MAARRISRARAAAPLGLRVEPVLDASPDAVVAVDEAGAIIYANPQVEPVFGWNADELLGEPVERLVPSRFVQSHEGLRRNHLLHPQARPMGSGLELAALRRDGTEFPVEVSLAPVTTDRGPIVIATVVDITSRANLRAELAQAHADLQEHADALEQRSRELMLLAQLRELLEACQTLEEAYGVLGGIAEQLFPGDAGALYALAPPHSDAEVVATWGRPAPATRGFVSTECWALRRGRIHVVQAGGPELRCPHVEEPLAGGHICIPLTAQADTLGLLHLQVRRTMPGPARTGVMAQRTRLVETLADELALALANLRLRATLRDQSSRDPLTGLFNRRAMEDTLERELRRAAREGYSLGVLLVDLDHFKDLNDAFGHPAGDAVLRAVGRFLASAVRGGDVACRLGGDEFVILLPKASLAATRRRAEALRLGLKTLQESEPGRLYPTTISVGVAASPMHGATADALLEAADRALYRAKARGRDRVAVATRRQAATAPGT